MLDKYSDKQLSKITCKSRQRMINKSAQEQLKEAKESWNSIPDEVPDADDSSINRSHLM